MNDPRAPQDPSTRCTTAADDARTSTGPDSSVTLPIIAESIDVEKIAVDRGGYRITKRVDTRDVLVDEVLRHETVTVERRPADRELADGEEPAVRYEGDTMIVPVVKEIVVTRKRLVLVEEIRITRVAGTHRDPRSVPVREEQVEIERLGAETSVIRSS